MRGLGITLAALVALAATARADDEPLDQARHDVESSDYLSARAHLTAALSAGGASPDELAEIYKLTGIVEAAVGDASIAKEAFAKWIALDPKAALPAGTSPKITRPFDAARKKAPKLELKTETSADPPSVTLVIGADPIGIAKARVLVSADGKPEHEYERDSGGGHKIKIDLPAGHRLDLRVEALDAKGNRIAVLGSKDVPIVVITAEPERSDRGDKGDGPDKLVDQPRHDKTAITRHPVVVHAEPRAWYASWRVWGIAAIVATAGTGVFVYETRSDIEDLDRLNANSIAHPFGDAQSTESRARRDLLVTDIGAGLTGVLALGTAWFYLTRPHDEIQLVAMPAPGGGAVAIGGRF
jgi:hypothetical protein